jgi:E-phenylitaconyl-CoA hydratase
MAGTVLYELHDHVATITYNRPAVLNAVNGDLRTDLNTAFARFRDDEEAWVGIVTGAGRAFCAGADLRHGGGATGTFPGSFWEKPTLNSFESGWEIYKPVIAAVNGYCLGYGLTLVSWCDFVLASDRARFGYPEATLGTPAMVGAIRLPQRIAWPDAMELLLTGEMVDADRARQMGLVWRVVAHDDLLPAAGELARRLTKGAPLAQRAMKEMAMRTPSGALGSDPVCRDDASGGRLHRGRPRRDDGRRRAAGAALARSVRPVGASPGASGRHPIRSGGGHECDDGPPGHRDDGSEP